MPSFRDGSRNILSLSNPGVYVDQILPTPFLTGVPSNIEGLVGVGSWGPVGAAQFFSTPDDCAAIFGVPQVRTFDIPTAVNVAYQQGTSIGFCGIRVSDGTDTAAAATLSGSAGVFTARHTGKRGNEISLNFQSTPQAGSYACVIGFPGRSPERFDNILKALQSLTVVAGTGYTSVPALAIAAPDTVGGVQASAQASLVAVSAALHSGGGGTGHVVNDVITLGAGVRVTVTAVASGVITTATLLTPGSIASGAVPALVGNQTASTGSGIGAVFDLVFGLGPATINAGFGYSAAPVLTMTGGGGSGGSYTPVASFWAALAYAVNTGTTQRGRSNYVVFSAASSTATPTLNTATALTGGTDGDSGVGISQMVGVDTRPRTGMYALRGSKCDAFALIDLTDPTSWAAQLSFAISEAMLAVVTTANGDSISNCIATRASEGIDDPNIWIVAGDWPTVYDNQSGTTRMVSPQIVAIGLLGNLSPEQSPINKQLFPVIATQSSQIGILISDADETIAQSGGIDIIGKSTALNEDFYSFLTGRNSSSNTAANGIEIPRLTNLLIKSLEGSATRSIVGMMQSVRIDDPTRAKASAILNSFFQARVDPASGSNGYGLIDQFAVLCDNTNNPPNLQAQGFLFAFCTVRYLNVVRYFVIKLAAGGNVIVSAQATPPTIAQLF